MPISQKIEISVIIPVYNAGKFVSQAVESALEQPETCEVILVEDGSPDNSLDVCTTLVERYSKVRLYRHEHGENKGAAASRNLGIKKATSSFVAFLDADDFYLPNRFAKSVEVLCSEQAVDGVYEAIGAVFEDDSSRDLFRRVGLHEMTTVKREIAPEELFKAFMKGGTGGYYHLDGFTARKHVFSKVAYFDERLAMYEDTMLMFQLSSTCRLFPGNLQTPVSMRRVHSLNRITYHFADKRKTYETTLNFWVLFLEWAKNNLPGEQVRWVGERIIAHMRNADFPGYSRLENFIYSRKGMLSFAMDNPGILLGYYFWRSVIP